ncbi:MAG: DNA translocase FtsK 4TM domain-containing protein, partial [Abditibacteriaceae bacterium]
MPDNLLSVSESEEDILEHHPSDADFYIEEMELPVRRKRATSSTTKKRSSRTSTSKKASSSKLIQRVPAGPWRYEISGLLLTAFCGILLFNALRPSAEGLLPRFGVGALRWVFGSGTSPILVMGLIAGLSLMLRRHHFHAKRYSKICATALLIFLTAIHLYIPKGQEFIPAALFTGGGAVGASIAWVLRRALGEWGALGAVIVASIIAAFHLCQLSFAEAATKLGSGVRQGASRIPRK